MLQRLRAEPRTLVRWVPSIVCGLIVCAGPLWLWGEPLRWFFLKSDDFVYIARSRTPEALCAALLRPHNGHVVPLFRLETHALVRLAGSLAAAPAVLGWASYATLVLAMAATGHVVARETGRTALGLTAMAAVGLTSVLGPTLLWYSAGQALAAGTMILVMLTALQAWRADGAWWALALALLAATAAPLFWSGGYAAGPVGIAYLWAVGHRDGRCAAALLAAATLITVGFAWSVGGWEFAPASQFATQPLGDALPVTAVVAHTAQAICEALILNNLGLNAATTAGQALLFCAMLAALWTWSRRRLGARGWPRPVPLEAAGAALVLATFAMIFAARGTEGDFDDLRALGWYVAMAELGAVLFVCGWWSACRPRPSPASPMPPRRLELLGVGLFAAAMLAAHVPRADRVVFEYDEMAAPLGPPSPRGAAPRTPADLIAQAKAQRAALAALDRLGPAARRGEIAPEAFRRMVGASVPGMPTHWLDFDPAELLALPVGSMHPPVRGGIPR